MTTTPLERLRAADSELFAACSHYPRTAQRNAYRQPMVISEAQYQSLLTGKLEPQLLQELQRGVTYRGNHYFSPEHFCYQCNVPFLLDDHNHMEHDTYDVPDGKYHPFVGYVSGNHDAHAGLFLPVNVNSIIKQREFLQHINI